MYPIIGSLLRVDTNSFSARSVKRHIRSCKFSSAAGEDDEELVLELISDTEGRALFEEKDS